MPTLPVQLQNGDITFIKLQRSSKIPVSVNGTIELGNHIKAQEWMDQGFNYGVRGDGGHIIIDADTAEIASYLFNNSAPTFCVKTPKQGYHFYYYCKGFIDKKVLHDPERFEESGEPLHIGEIQATGVYCVGPHSLYPETHQPYIVHYDAPITVVSKVYLDDLLGKFMKKEKAVVALTDNTNISVVDVLRIAGVQMEVLGDQLCCAHPVHGSSTGMNFVVHPAKNVWHCFRHQTGGGPFSLIAMLEGIINCDDCRVGGLVGDNFLKMIDIAKKKYGYVEPQKVKDFNMLPNQKFEDYLAQYLCTTQPPRRYPIGIDFLDQNSNGGMTDATMALIAARTKGGKSTILIDFAYRWARQGHKVLFLELEMTQQEIHNRFIGRHCGINYWDIENINTVAQAEVQQKMQTLKPIMANIDVVAQPITTLDLEDVKRIIKEREVIHGRFNMIVIDYAGVMDTTDKKEYWERSKQIAVGIRAITLLENRIIVIAAQANNKAEDGAIDVFDRVQGSSEWGKKSTWMLFIERKKEQVPVLDKNGNPTMKAKDGPDYIKQEVMVDGKSIPVGTVLKVTLAGRSVIQETQELGFSHAVCAFADNYMHPLGAEFNGMFDGKRIVSARRTTDVAEAFMCIKPEGAK
jgi:archaellum biogenesis ATPase FlaH